MKGWRHHSGYTVLPSPLRRGLGVTPFAYEHTVIVEGLLGHRLRTTAPIHHVNGIPTDNRHENLVVCEDHAYHMLLHLRQRALDECGNPNWRKCVYCHTWDDPLSMKIHSAKATARYFHRRCQNARAKPRKRAA